MRAWPVNADRGEDADVAWNSDHRRDLNSGHEVSLNRLKRRVPGQRARCQGKGAAGH